MKHDILQQYRISAEPYYHPQAQEIQYYQAKLPMMLKGPTGCGKSRFIAYMAWQLAKPLLTIACNEDTTAADLLGRYLLDANGTRWVDGPLTIAARSGAICYLDEVVEARQDTMVVIHSLTDHRRELFLDKKGELVKAHPDFQLVISYNPHYQALMKDLKPSTKQRFCALLFQYPSKAVEANIICNETQITADMAQKLVEIAHASRQLVGHGLTEGISTRLLIYAALLMQQGIAPLAAGEMALINPITDNADIKATLSHAISMILG